jgi:glutathione S-transferase
LDLILHHYDPSPYSEKIRLVFGLKKLAWRSVIVPMVLPKPTLTPLTGGFRRTPVLQIGADIYCDTLRIAMELDRRFPSPCVMPAAVDGLSNIVGTWAERVLMWPTARYVTGLNRQALPRSFFADRAAMRGHAMPDPNAVDRSLPHQRRQLDLMLGWIENRLADGREYLIAENPVLADLAVYQRLWWLGALESKATGVLDPYPRIVAWMARIAAAGHGSRQEISPEDALDIARSVHPEPIPADGPSDDIAAGTAVRIATEDFGPDPVEGTVLRANHTEISVRRDDPALGTIHVHFPRLGYEATPV